MVAILMLIPLLAPQEGGGAVPIAVILKALGAAGVKAVLCIVGIIAGGRLLVSEPQGRGRK